VPELGLISASMDCTIKTFDLAREKVVQTCDLHTKGVKDFVYCRCAEGAAAGRCLHGAGGQQPVMYMLLVADLRQCTWMHKATLASTVIHSHQTQYQIVP
jgi:hypothetical protein